MAAEIVVIFENQNSSGIAEFSAKKVRGRKPANAAPHNDEIVSLARVDNWAGILPKCTVAKGMNHFKGTGMAAAHSRTLRRIVGRVLRGKTPRWSKGAERSDGDCHSVDEVTPGDCPVHPKFAI